MNRSTIATLGMWTAGPACTRWTTKLSSISRSRSPVPSTSTKSSSRGGGFTVWPRSHRLTEEYFTGHTYGDYSAEQDALHDLEPGPAFEITGGPGTLVLWHHNISHGAAPNHSERIRMAGFQRIAYRDIANIGQSALSDIWKMYPALRDLHPVYHQGY